MKVHNKKSHHHKKNRFAECQKEPFVEKAQSHELKRLTQGNYWHFCVQSENYQMQKHPLTLDLTIRFAFLILLATPFSYETGSVLNVILHTELATSYSISYNILWLVHIQNRPNWPSPALVLVPQPPPSALALWPQILAWWQISWHHHMFTPIHMHTQYNPSTEGRTKDLSLAQ